MLDFAAIYKAYTDVVHIDNGKKKAYDKDWKEVTIEQSKVDAARVELDKLNYQSQRKAEYPSVVDQLDDIYHNGIDGWKATIKATKDKYPKP